jgi:hypothetical protein
VIAGQEFAKFWNSERSEQFMNLVDAVTNVIFALKELKC